MFLRITFYFLAGLFSGVFSGMGMGGGTLLIPMLTLIYNMPQQTAQAVNLIAFIPMAIVAVIIHAKNKLLDFKGAWLMIIPGILFAVLFSFLAKNMEGDLLKKLFGGFLILLAALQIILTFIQEKNNKKSKN